MKLSHIVLGALWNEEEGLWHVRVQTPDGTEFEDTCEILINGGGHLKQVLSVLDFSIVADKSSPCSNWKWPEVKGLHSFKGTLQHSAHYDESTDLTGKQVAVIGMGSSGIQITAKIGPIAKKLYSWVRSPTWVTAGFAQRYAGSSGRNFECEAHLCKLLK